jgi:hypothetical protein
MSIRRPMRIVLSVAARPMVGDLDLAPGAVCVEEDEQVDRAVAPILAVVAFELARRGRDRLVPASSARPGKGAEWGC